MYEEIVITPEETLKKVQELKNTPNTGVKLYPCDYENIIAALTPNHTYEWHDLLKDPTDLPEIYRDVFFVYSSPAMALPKDCYGGGMYVPGMFDDKGLIYYVAWRYADRPFLQKRG